MSIMNSGMFGSIMGGMGGGGNGQQDSSSKTMPMKKSGATGEADNNAMNSFINDLLQGGSKPVFNLAGYGQGFSVGSNDGSQTIPLSILVSRSIQPQQQQAGGGAYRWLGGLK